MVKHPKRQNLTLFILLLFTFSFISCARAIKDTVDIETVFCPREDCHAVFLSTLKNATTIDCAFYDLDDPPLISLLKAKQAHLVMDEDNAISSDKEHLHIRKGKGLMHNKFCILDGKTVLTGSLNPTTNGFTRNNNNLLIINSRKNCSNHEKPKISLIVLIKNRFSSFEPTATLMYLLSCILKKLASVTMTPFCCRFIITFLT